MGASALGGRGSVPPAPTRPPSAPLLARFDEFALAAREFSRSVMAAAPSSVTEEPAEAAAHNLAIVRSVFSKWNLEILALLYSLHTLGFEEIRRQLRAISSPVLSRKLRFLHANGLIERTVLSTPVIRVQYSLAPRGKRVAQLGEPVLLYLRLTEGRFAPEERFVAHGSAARPRARAKAPAD
jgi:DNA-binding HxlR family transcriptional regulator